MRRRAGNFGAVVLLATCLVGVGLGSWAAARTTLGDISLTASGSLNPSSLPRSEQTPITLHLGFDVEDTTTHTAPALSSFAFELAPSIDFTTAGLPSCPRSKLLSTYANPMRACGHSLVGHGTVVSEITLPGEEAPRTVHGRMLAFYSERNGEPGILARINGGGDEPIVYVIPVELRAGDRSTTLLAPKMRAVMGIFCPYGCGHGHLSGIYSHILHFRLSLNRAFTSEEERRNLVTASCPRAAPQQLVTAVIVIRRKGLQATAQESTCTASG